MSVLESSWILEDRLKNLNCDIALKILILTYIEKNKPRKGEKFSNISYRCNLHYIEDNINNPIMKEQLINNLK